MNSGMKHIIPAFLFAFALAPAVSAQTLPAGAGRYEACIALIDMNSGRAFDQALAWESEGGGPPARHCAALALIGQGAEEEGALRLEALAQEPGSGGAEMRASLLAQAASAWILADQPGRAEKILTTALALADGNAELYLSRGEARALQGSDEAALADVSQAAWLNPLDPEAYIFRAALLRQQNKPVEALADLETALKLAPRNLGALLVRGRLLEDAGDRAAARRDYIAVLKWGEDGPQVIAARAALERLDLNVN